MTMRAVHPSLPTKHSTRALSIPPRRGENFVPGAGVVEQSLEVGPREDRGDSSDGSSTSIDRGGAGSA